MLYKTSIPFGKREERRERVSGETSPFPLLLPLNVVALAIAFASVFGFGVGKICRSFVLKKVPGDRSSEGQPAQAPSCLVKLPHPVLSHGKRIPRATYTSKLFNGAKSSNSILLTPYTGRCEAESLASEVPVAGPQEHSFPPIGQHLMVDIEHVDGTFLNSEERLAKSMVELVGISQSTLLSYHCHAFAPSGVSCVGILLESHVAIHTWPKQGVISIDFYACGSTSLRPLVEHSMRLFGIPRRKAAQRGEQRVPLEPSPRMQWKFENRGFDRSDGPRNLDQIDYYLYLHNVIDFDLKQEVVNIESKFQTIEIWDIINPRRRPPVKSYQKSLAQDGSYESQHAELFQPDRLLYLNKILQSRRYGESSYHESLVHPAMFAHKWPERVAIIGGGEGATLREVLKHKTVEKVTMIDIDEVLVNISRQYLPEWSDCSNLVGSTASCFDDPRANVYYKDAIAWFVDRFGDDEDIDPQDQFDVIIMDGLDPGSVVEFSDALYDNDDLVGAFSNALTDEGVFVVQVGEMDEIDEPPGDFANDVLDTSFIPHLVNHGFEKIKNIEDFHGGFNEPWSYMIAFMDAKSSEYWYANPASTDLQIRKRILPTPAGESPLKYFDGATMQSLAYPSRIGEDVFCHKLVKPPYCSRSHGFDPERQNVDVSKLEVKASGIYGAARGAFFKDSFPKGSYIAVDEGVHDMLILPRSVRLLTSMLKASGSIGKWRPLSAYIDGYGFASGFYGGTAYMVDSGPKIYVNHGCSATNNIGAVYSVTEMTTDPDFVPVEFRKNDIGDTVYNTFIDRNHLLYIRPNEIMKGVKAGDEVLGNDLDSLSQSSWKDGVKNLRVMCLGLARGEATA